MATKKKTVALKPGYVTSSSIMETDTGKVSAQRLVSPMDSSAEIDGYTVKIVDAVTNFVIQDTAEKAAKESKEESAEIIRVYASEVRKANAKKGDYNKSYQINGKLVKKMQYAVSAISTDKFSTPSKKEDILNLKTALGEGVFNELFVEEASISIRKDVMENEVKRKELSKKLVDLFGIAGLKDYFERSIVLKTKPGLDEKQYKLDTDIQDKLLKAKVIQAADSLKGASKVVL